MRRPCRSALWQIEALEALLEHERGEGRAREQRHKLTVERLRRQVTDLQVSSSTAYASAPQPCQTCPRSSDHQQQDSTWALQLLPWLMSYRYQEL